MSPARHFPEPTSPRPVQPDRAHLELAVPEPEPLPRRTGCLWAIGAGLAFWAALGAVFVWWRT